ncbi:MAG: HEAT repeat domain-containing protein [Hydrococcus sp. Prado102]|nr:HEAT repeat domain-containing protein [Hydrococcus sp. Prado102]
MLEGLERINWSELFHARGEATDIPNLLRSLASEQKELRDDALSKLYDNLLHQETIYEATSYAIPFLIELLSVPTEINRVGVLGLLNAIASCAYFNIYQSSYWHCRDSDMMETWIQPAYQAVLKGLPVYLQLLSHREPNLRCSVSYLLAVCIERRAEIERAFRQQISLESDAAVRMNLVMELGQLLQYTKEREAVETLRSLLFHPDTDVQKLAQETLKNIVEEQYEYGLEDWGNWEKIPF